MEPVTKKIARSSERVADGIALTLLFVAAFSSFALTSSREQDFYQHHVDQAEHATSTLKKTTEALIEQKRWISRIFLQNNSDLVARLIEDPEDEQAFQQIDSRLGRYFLDYYTFNIISNEGVLLVDDFDGLLGEICIRDVRNFQKHNKTDLRLHPHPKRFHYDIPSTIEHNGKTYTVLVSFDFGDIAALIRKTQVQDHDMMLVYRDMGYLIEASSLGSRYVIRDRHDYRMTREEIGRILHERAIEGTRWYAVDLHQSHLFDEHNSILRIHGLTLFAVELLVISLIWHALRKHYRYMARQQDALQTRNREISHINKTLHRNSITDELTGLQNRRYFREASRMHWDMAQRNQVPITVLMIDVDHFKLYNDGYGHVKGDQCLLRAARVMKDSYTRSVDILARYGGEEFIIMTLDSSFEESVHRAEELRQAIEDLHMEHAHSGVSDYVTVSIGLAHMIPCQSVDIENLVQRADNALYEAKESGRNRVVGYDFTTCSRGNEVCEVNGNAAMPASSASGHSA